MNSFAGYRTYIAAAVSVIAVVTEYLTGHLTWEVAVITLASSTAVIQVFQRLATASAQADTKAVLDLLTETLPLLPQNNVVMTSEQAIAALKKALAAEAAATAPPQTLNQGAQGPTVQVAPAQPIA